MDDEEYEIALRDAALSTPRRHGFWSFAVLTADLLNGIAKEVQETLDTATILLSQHRLHKEEESKFYEVVIDLDNPS